MKIKNSEVIKAISGVNTLMSSGIQFPIDTSWEIVKLAGKLDEFSKPINKIREQLFEQFSTIDKDGRKMLDRDSKNYAEYVQSMQAIGDKEVEIDIQPIRFPTILDGKKLSISPGTLFNIAKFITLEFPPKD